jgi:hypothetical protein
MTPAKFVLPKIFGAFGAISFISYAFPYGPRKKNHQIFLGDLKKTHQNIPAQNLFPAKFVSYKNFTPPR